MKTTTSAINSINKKRIIYQIIVHIEERIKKRLDHFLRPEFWYHLSVCKRFMMVIVMQGSCLAAPAVQILTSSMACIWIDKRIV